VMKRDQRYLSGVASRYVQGSTLSLSVLRLYDALKNKCEEQSTNLLNNGASLYGITLGLSELQRNRDLDDSSTEDLH
jgi:hypothetical protein